MSEPTWIMVTGGASGIGAATTEFLARNGASVICADRNIDQAITSIENLQSGAEKPLTIIARQVDVTDEAALGALFSELAQSGIRVTGLVNCAGINVRQPALDVTPAAWGRVLDVNLTGTFLASTSFVRELSGSGLNGQIVNVTSMLAHYGAPGLASYAASKGGVMALTRSLAVEWAALSIRVNAVSPGYIFTALAAPLFDDANYKAEILARTPMGRLGDPADVARVIAFLLSENSGFVTGQIIPVDGGITAGDVRLGPR